MTTRQARPYSRMTAFALVSAILLAVTFGAVSSVYAAEFNPERIISTDNMRAFDSMSKAQIQAFLETQTGPLASLVTTDFAGVERPASQIIWQACQTWRISPKVMLAMLQKEQSLLTRTWLAPNTLARAVGAGCPDSKTNRYPGFGRQVYNGARLLNSYGESSTACPPYFYGIARKDIYRKPTVTLSMHNIATYKLFVYNPSIGADAPYGDLSSQAGKTTGNANFWVIYRRYFGSTFADPTMRPVYRFRNRSNGTYLYTSSVAMRYNMTKPEYAKRWAYSGRPYSWDASVPSTQTTPVYAFKKKSSGKYTYTTSRATYESRRTRAGRRTWEYKGVAYRVSRSKAEGSVTVYRFRNRRSGASLLTATSATVKRYRTDRALRRAWEYKGAIYHLRRAVI